MPDELDQTRLTDALERFRAPFLRELRDFMARSGADPALDGFYGQMAYHLGWVDEQMQPATLPPGKLLRPALLLWSCALASDTAESEQRLSQAMPAAVAIELIHNFSLIHDDIEDHDEYRRHRRTLWSIWGAAQGINTGDGVFCLAHLALWEIVARGVAPHDAAQIAALLDRTALRLCEGQYLDMAAEGQATATPASYIAVIIRKTAALMRAATEIGARIGAPAQPDIAVALGEFGEALGIAFQVRDDLLGIWADSADLGKAAAGDLRRKKMSLPVIHALANAPASQRARLAAIYATPPPATTDEIDEMLTTLAATQSQAWCRQELARHCQRARAALDRAGATTRRATAPFDALVALLDFTATATA
jgi:geranylgeranyl diphosphate synthase type I